MVVLQRKIPLARITKETAGGNSAFLLLQQPGGSMVWSAGHQVPPRVNLVWRDMKKSESRHFSCVWRGAWRDDNKCNIKSTHGCPPSRSWSCCEYPHTAWILRHLFSSKIPNRNEIGFLKLRPFFSHCGCFVLHPGWSHWLLLIYSVLLSAKWSAPAPLTPPSLPADGLL